MKKALSVFLVLMCYAFSSQGEDRSVSIDSLNVLIIKNKNLLPILDSILDHEKGCDYYRSNLLFFVHLQRVDSTSLVQIGSVGFESINTNNYKGCFEYQGHFFLVSGNLLDKSLFSKTERKKPCLYCDKKNINNNLADKAVLVPLEDDTFSYWNYVYEDNTFVFEDKSTFCK